MTIRHLRKYKCIFHEEFEHSDIHRIEPSSTIQRNLKKIDERKFTLYFHMPIKLIHLMHVYLFHTTRKKLYDIKISFI